MSMMQSKVLLRCTKSDLTSRLVSYIASRSRMVVSGATSRMHASSTMVVLFGAGSEGEANADVEPDLLGLGPSMMDLDW